MHPEGRRQGRTAGGTRSSRPAGRGGLRWVGQKMWGRLLPCLVDGDSGKRLAS